MITDAPTEKSGENIAKIVFEKPGYLNKKELRVSHYSEARKLGNDMYLQIDATELRVSRESNPKIHKALKKLQEAIIQENGGKWTVFEHGA